MKKYLTLMCAISMMSPNAYGILVSRAALRVPALARTIITNKAKNGQSVYLDTRLQVGAVYLQVGAIALSPLLTFAAYSYRLLQEEKSLQTKKPVARARQNTK